MVKTLDSEYYLIPSWESALRDFADAFRRQPVGWVYFSNGGQGEGRLVSDLARTVAIEELGKLYFNSRRNITKYSKIFIVAFLATSVLPFVMPTLWTAIVTVSILTTYVYIVARQIITPNLYKSRFWKGLERNAAVEKLSRSKQVTLGYRLSFKHIMIIMLIVLAGGYLEMHRLRPADRVALLGSQGAEIQDIVFYCTILLSCIFFTGFLIRKLATTLRERLKRGKR